MPSSTRAATFTSPLPDIEATVADADKIYAEPDALPAIQLRDVEQLALARSLLDTYRELPFPADRSSDFRFWWRDNGFFGYGEAFWLYAMLRRYRPARVIEVGSGFSSALMLDTDERYLGGSTSFTFVEPHPERLESLLRGSDEGREVVKRPVQDVPVALFQDLRAGDVLFVDSSHVSRIASDVNHIFFTILPTLESGVLVHIHDVAWPFEYPLDWIEEGRAWNEAYVLRAFLQYNAAFEILLFSSNLPKRLLEAGVTVPEEMVAGPGSSFWMQKR